LINWITLEGNPSPWSCTFICSKRRLQGCITRNMTRHIWEACLQSRPHRRNSNITYRPVLFLACCTVCRVASCAALVWTCPTSSLTYVIFICRCRVSCIRGFQLSFASRGNWFYVSMIFNLCTHAKERFFPHHEISASIVVVIINALLINMDFICQWGNILKWWFPLFYLLYQFPIRHWSCQPRCFFQEHDCVCVCVCVWERERGGGNYASATWVICAWMKPKSDILLYPLFNRIILNTRHAV
jgi:hypothetical protein